jgi:phosphopantothenoylcysteine decarboxylase/phosphopantothenate--cysteine ligase
LNGRRIVLGVCGSIAAPKAADVASKLVQEGATVAVVMTPHATRFITPLTFQAITRTRVMSDPFDEAAVLDPTHISLLDGAHLVLIAPATANVLGKIAHGIADDMLTSLMLAVRCPVLIAPAMNDRMWANPIVQENIAKLRALKMEFIDPEEGYLACGTTAMGRLADPAAIVRRVLQRLAP